MEPHTYQITDRYMKRELFRALKLQGYTILGREIIPPRTFSKDDIRDFHLRQRQARLLSEQEFYYKRGFDLISKFFANGEEINTSLFDPEIVPVETGRWTGDLFRVAAMLWSVPVSKGYGRRMRFLVIDKSNDKLVGIIALGDPVFNLKVRDDFIGWNSNDRKERLFHVMDAYVLGAVPPYNELLAGKFLAGMLSTNEIRREFQNKYSNTRTIIQGKVKPANLVLVTTTSALGRSSVYNRVFYDLGNHRIQLLQKIGFTAGYGHFHVPEETFEMMREFLKERNDNYASGHKFGNGPNWRMRVIRKTMQYLGYSKTPILQHGVRREVFVSPLASNFREYLCGQVEQPDFYDFSLMEYTKYFRERFMIPRFHRIGGLNHHKVIDVNLRIEDCLANEPPHSVRTEIII